VVQLFSSALQRGSADPKVFFFEIASGPGEKLTVIKIPELITTPAIPDLRGIRMQRTRFFVQAKKERKTEPNQIFRYCTNLFLPNNK